MDSRRRLTYQVETWQREERVSSDVWRSGSYVASPLYDTTLWQIGYRSTA